MELQLEASGGDRLGGEACLLLVLDGEGEVRAGSSVRDVDSFPVLDGETKGKVRDMGDYWLSFRSIYIKLYVRLHDCTYYKHIKMKWVGIVNRQT